MVEAPSTSRPPIFLSQSSSSGETGLRGWFPRYRLTSAVLSVCNTEERGGMLRRTAQVLGGGRKWWKEGSPDFTRANARRAVLERKRIEASHYVPPIEPTPAQACALYRQFLKEGERRLVVTDKAFFRRKVRYEFEVTARQTSSRVRGIMFEKGHWMLANELGGVV